VFFKGNYLEVGINWNGAFGSSADAPSGFHPNGTMGDLATCSGACYTNTRNIGFVADPDKDGWSTGSPYKFIGDYFLPGEPQEGWSIMADDTEKNAWNGHTCASGIPIFDTGLTGSNTSYSLVGKTFFGRWDGTYGTLAITQNTSLDTDALALNVNVKIKNTGSSTRHNVYYLRTVDPDNTEAETGRYATYNKIEYKLPNPNNRTIVSALGYDTSGIIVPSSFFALGTIDCRAKAFILRGVNLYTITKIDSMYNAYGGKGDTVNYQFNGADSNDQAIGLIYKFGDINAGDSVTFNFSYIFSRAEIDSTFTVHPATWSVGGDVKMHDSKDTAITCMNATVAINLERGNQYSWTWTATGGHSIVPTLPTSASVSVGTVPVTITAIGLSPCGDRDTVIMVLNPGIPSIIPTISISGPTLVKVGYPVTINALVSSAGSLYEIYWKKNGVLFDSSATPSIVYAKGAGTDNIIANITPLSAGCYQSATSNTWVVGENTAVAQVDDALGIKVYPNPFNDKILVGGIMKGDIVSIFDASGKTVSHMTVSNSQKQQLINLESLSPGYYILKVSGSNNTIKASIPLQKL